MGSAAGATAGADMQTATRRSMPTYADLHEKKVVSLDHFHSPSKSHRFLGD